jgi:hypothetical protein
MVKTKSIDRTTEKWQRKVSVAGSDYEAGVRDPAVPWNTATKEAEPRYKEAVVKAAGEGRFGRGVDKAGDKWNRNVIEKGIARWPDGVSKAGPDYTKGMAPVLAAINATTLPARYPGGDERNLERVRVMNKSVHNATKGK